MTVLKSAAFLIQCDDPSHKGDPIVTVNVGTRVDCEAGMRSEGWRINLAGTMHRCPPCANRRTLAN